MSIIELQEGIMKSERMSTDVTEGRKSPYINKTKLFQIPVINNHYELLADKEGNHVNTLYLQEPQKIKGKGT